MSRATPHALKLYGALKNRRIKCNLEEYDGHKHIDISSPWAELDIEIDGVHHFTDPEQIHKDLERAYWSSRDGFDTIHISNILIDKHLNEIADAIAKVARDRFYENQESNGDWF